MKPVTLLLILLLSLSGLFCQEMPMQNNITTKNAISLGLCGTSFLFGFSYSRFISEKFSIDKGLGYIGSRFKNQILLLPTKVKRLVFDTGL